MPSIGLIGERLAAGARNGVRWVVGEAGRVVDMPRFRAATSWRDRLATVSWPRLGVVTGGLVAIIAGVSLLPDGRVRPDANPEIRAHAPRLPSEQEWRASQEAARAMEAELSPALAAANQSVTE